MYHKMKSRHEVTFTLEEFHKTYLEDNKYLRLYSEWVNSGFNIQYKPSIDRIDNRKPYEINNIHMMTWAENRYKQSALDGKRGRKPAVYQMLGEKIIRRFTSQRDVVRKLGISQGCLSMVLNGKRNTVAGYRFVYENPELLVKEK